MYENATKKKYFQINFNIFINMYAKFWKII